MAAFVLFLMLTIIIFPRKMHFEVSLLDVGQGDGIFISTEQGATVFVDGGSTSKNNVGKYTLLPFLKYRGIRQVDYWIVSHCDEDHINGLEEVIRNGYSIGNLVVSPVIEDAKMQELMELAKDHKIGILKVKKGDAIQFSPSERMTFVWPKEAYESEDRNDNSLCFWYANSFFAALFAGDIPSEVEQSITADKLFTECLAQRKASDLFLLYKSNHHGSKYSNSQEFLDALEANLTVISCGKKNRYGHPHGETLERLEQCGCYVVRTDEVGQISIAIDDGRLVIKVFDDSKGLNKGGE